MAVTVGVVREVTVTEPGQPEVTVVTTTIPGATGPTGRGIASVVRTSGDGSSGSTDVYTMTFTDGSTTTFTIYQGLDGGAAGELSLDPTLLFENALL